MPQRPGYNPPVSSPFGPSIFTPGWSSSRDRSSTLHSIQSQPSNGPDSPVRSNSQDFLEHKTLDYLGLVDTPQPARATLAPSSIEILLENQRNAISQNINNNRFRSYSVNASSKYEDDLEGPAYPPGLYSGTLTPTQDPETLALMEEVRLHNAQVEAFKANFENVTRPRARTAGVLDAPTRFARNHGPSRLESTYTAADADESDYGRMAEALKLLNLGGRGAGADDGAQEQGPTRSLWLGNIPSSTTVSSLDAIFSTFGPIESTRVLTHKNCGFVNFEYLDSARRAKEELNGKEIFPGAPVRIGYAKEPSATATPGHNGLYPSPSPDPHARGQADGVNASTSSSKLNNLRPENANAPPKTPELPDMRGDILAIVKDLGASEDEQAKIAAQVDQAIKNDNYLPEIPPVGEPTPNRVHDAPKLRDIRKRIDNGNISATEIEEIAKNMLPEIAELSSDYLGNTVVQKLFEYCTEDTQVAMLEQIAPHLATIGTHKNGTWAAQKIIDVARKSNTLQQMIVQALAPYAIALFQDQFGNYVIQGCLRFDAPTNNFIFEAMLARLWDLAQGRFSSRAMRACLESHNASKDQQRMIAAAIALHSVQLATNANGALLLTWFLDTCNFQNRRTVLAPRLVPHLVHLGTHKVAYLTVLKLVNQRNEVEARDTILRALFFSPNDQVLEDILADPQCGATFIWKVLTTPFFDDSIRPDVTENVRKVLIRIKAQAVQGYKRLMDEVNLPTQRSGAGHRDHSATRTNPSRGSPGPVHVDPSGRIIPVTANGGFDPVILQRTASADSSNFEQYPMGANGTMFMPMAANAQQVPYFAASRNGQYYTPVTGYPAPGSGIESFRNVSPSAAPGFAAPGMLPPTGAGPQMAPAMGAQVPYGYGAYMSPQQQAPSGSQRRGRVSTISALRKQPC